MSNVLHKHHSIKQKILPHSLNIFYQCYLQSQTISLLSGHSTVITMNTRNKLSCIKTKREIKRTTILLENYRSKARNYSVIRHCTNLCPIKYPYPSMHSRVTSTHQIYIPKIYQTQIYQSFPKEFPMNSIK